MPSAGPPCGIHPMHCMWVVRASLVDPGWDAAARDYRWSALGRPLFLGPSPLASGTLGRAWLLGYLVTSLCHRATGPSAGTLDTDMMPINHPIHLSHAGCGARQRIPVFMRGPRATEGWSDAVGGSALATARPTHPSHHDSFLHAHMCRASQPGLYGLLGSFLACVL